ncbi:MAG: hypothetical protein IKR73_07920 [Oscillospiraceae bacterium]|nr:hypothetical protein [Oscillospiraceae bacterium]
MDKVAKVVTNKWFKLAVSLIGVVYTALLLYFDYIVFFYNIEYTEKKKFAVIAAILSVLVCLLDLYTRHSPITCILAMLNMPIFLPLLLLDWGNWPLLLPAGIVTLFGFFCCHMNETAKTIFGTIFLLMYILGGIAFFLVMNVFRVTTVDTMIERGVSPSGAFRYYVLDVANKSTGKKCVYIQPNTLDDDKGFIKLDTTIRKLVKQQSNPVEFECEWSGTRMFINGEEYFDELDYIGEQNGVAVYDIADRGWNYTYFHIDYPIFTTIESVKDKLGVLQEKRHKDDAPASSSKAKDDEEDSKDKDAEDAEDTDGADNSEGGTDSSDDTNGDE